MNRQSSSLSDAQLDKQEVIDSVDSGIDVSTNPPVDNGKHFNGISLFWHDRWQYWLSCQELRDRLGPFIIPVLVFLVAAAFSIIIAYNKVDALRSFREEVFDPLLYVGLALYCLRS